MREHKFIYWRPDLPKRDGRRYANVHFLVDHNQASLADFQEMADELRKSFPQAKNSEIRVGKIYKSSFAQNFTIIAWSAHLPEGDYPGWQHKEDEPVEYLW